MPSQTLLVTRPAASIASIGVSDSKGQSLFANGFDGTTGKAEVTANGYGQAVSVQDSTVPIQQALSKVAREGKEEDYDLVCVGFGPASLAVAIALDEVKETLADHQPKLRFVEKQSQFRWHSGMLLPGTKMQISFIKDLASQRNPCSYFTFLNYLKEHDRLVQFSNLDTFLPSRLEFEDYLSWAASHFNEVVDYSEEVQQVLPVRTANQGVYDWLEVRSKNLQTGQVRVRRSKRVLIAVGGKASRPAVFPNNHARILHSSEYSYGIGQVLPVPDQEYTVAVIGSGQSAAEVFSDLQSRFPNALTRLIMRDTALRPSDDSPFVNEIFNPEAVDSFYAQPKEARERRLIRDKATNYSVVRLGLIEKLYEEQYLQGIRQPDRSKWPHQILTSREVVEVTDTPNKRLQLTLRNLDGAAAGQTETIVVDAVVLATGYQRNAHVDMLKDCQPINANKDGDWQVERDYSVKLNQSRVAPDVGIWLQGTNERTHGLSDTLLSILATRSGEIVQTMFARTA
ncbi:hypothetical protein DV735_g2997, partial [Chaetothyriales sp. CBS 134920]